MNTLLEGASGMPAYTDLRCVFAAFADRQMEFNWLLTDIDCIGAPPLLQTAQPVWLSGHALTTLVRQYDMQFVWAVLSGFLPDVRLDLAHLACVPYAEGNRALWSPGVTLQYPGATIELVCWDSSATLVLSTDDDLTRRFRGQFPEAIDLDAYNQQRASR